MKVLVVDCSTESQAFLASKIQAFSPSDIEILDLRLKLTGNQDYMERVVGADVLIIGADLAVNASSIARNVKASNPSIHIIMFVTDESYSGGTFRSAHLFGVRKVFPNSVSSLDLLQELIAIHTSFRMDGRTREGKVIAITHVKGGVGATSLAAALGELCNDMGRKTLLWDLDIESRDLCRALMVNSPQSAVVTAWVNGSRDINRQSLQDAIFSISSQAGVLQTPDKFREALDLVCHVDCAPIAQRVIDLARLTHDVVIVDTAGRMGPSIGTVLRAADSVVLVTDDSTLGLTAIDFYLSTLRELLGGLDKVAIVCSGNTQVSTQQIQTELTTAHKLPTSSWRLPPIPYDPRGGKWPGQGKTLYSLGQPQTRQAIEQMAVELELFSAVDLDQAGEKQEVKAKAPISSVAARAQVSKNVIGKVYNRIFDQ